MGERPFPEHAAPNPEFPLLPQSKLPFKSTGAQQDHEAESNQRKDLRVWPWPLQGV